MIWVLENSDQIGAAKLSRVLAQILADKLGCAQKVFSLPPPRSREKLFFFMPVLSAPSRYNEALTPPWPDITISCGWKLVPAALAIRQAAGGATFAIQIHPPPRTAMRFFDAIVASVGDNIQGDNIFSIVGMPERYSSFPLSDLRNQSATRYANLPRPLTTILIGGQNRAFHLDEPFALKMAQDIRRALEKTGGSYLITLSRRSPSFLQPLLQEQLKNLPRTYMGSGRSKPL